jgi:carotenoid 1,2-hydratase
MRTANIPDVGAVRPSNSTTARNNAGHDTDGFQHVVSGDGGCPVRPQLTRMDRIVSAAGSANQDTGNVSGWGEHASGSRRTDGGAVGPLGGLEPARGPDFARVVHANGYAWWYVDALSDDGQNGITIIAFIGSVFSPYYAFARRQGVTDPLNHCAVNVAIYRKNVNRWTMTERPRGAVSRTANRFTVGPSQLDWDGTSLTIRIKEISVPIPARISGTVRIVPTAVTQQAFSLNEHGHHWWWPIAPCARVQVALDRPRLRWQGDGYFDMNGGDAPLECSFSDWQWSRGVTQNGTAILYEARRLDGSRVDLAVTYDPQGRMQIFEPPPVVMLKRTGWRIGRGVRSDGEASIVRTLEDAPFYARSIVSAKILGEPVTLMHESLSLDRFKMPLVQAMLPFRMPRARK